jgi:hypothetical protein
MPQGIARGHAREAGLAGATPCPRARRARLRRCDPHAQGLRPERQARGTRVCHSPAVRWDSCHSRARPREPTGDETKNTQSGATQSGPHAPIARGAFVADVRRAPPGKRPGLSISIGGWGATRGWHARGCRFAQDRGPRSWAKVLGQDLGPSLRPDLRPGLARSGARSGQVWGQVGGQVWGQVWGQVCGQVWGQVWGEGPWARRLGRLSFVLELARMEL